MGLGYYNASIDALGLIIDEITTKWARKKKTKEQLTAHTQLSLLLKKRNANATIVLFKFYFLVE